MAIFNSFTFDNENSLDSGIYITGEAVFNAPKRVVEMVNVPGRNGAIAIDEGRFENIPVKYPAGCFADNMADFTEKVANFRNILASRFTYKRLEDTYYPDEFRMGLYRSGLEVDVVNQARAGKFDIEFDCKPQRFLKSGEIPVEYTPGQTPSDEQTKTGSIATFEAEEGTIISDIKADINPVQDLHGYDKPWAGGNGKNLLSMTVAGIKAVNTSGTWSGNEYTYKGVTFSVLVDSDNNVTGVKTSGTANDAVIFGLGSFNAISGTSYTINGSPSGKSDSTYRLWGEGAAFPAGNRISDGRNERQTATAAATESTPIGLQVFSGVNVNNLTFYPMVRIASDTDSTFAPYTNICPISGWDSVKVTRTGKNLLDEGYTFGNINAQGADSGTSSNFIRTVNFSPIKASTQYYIHAQTSLGAYRQLYRVEYDKDMNALNRVQMINGWNESDYYKGRFTATEKTAYVRFFIYSSTVFANYSELKMWLSLDETTSNEPYQGNTYTIDLDGTRYGGTLDVTSGVMTITHKAEYFDSSFNWQYRSPSGFYIYDSQFALAPDTTGFYVKSNLYGQTNWETKADKCISAYATTSTAVIIFDSRFTSVADFKAAMPQEGIQIWYPLATPITVQLTPTEVKTLLGTNNIWADSGDITVKYGTSPYIIVNPTDFPSKPLLEVTGVGSFWLGDTQITITGTSGQIIYIDCETGECYKATGGIISPANGLVTLNRLDFPKLASGINNIQLGSGISKVKITPRWWRL